MNSNEKFCLKWNDFKENVSNTFGTLRDDTDFTDVTLACEDGQQVEAHKVILASSSPFFQNLLKRNNHQHPLIYMRGLKFDNLVAILDFLYHGEANIYQENLDSFLVIAEELKLKGLTGSESDKEENERQHDQIINSDNQTYFANNKDKPRIQEQDYKISENFLKKVADENILVSNNTVALTERKVTVSEIQELDDKIKSMMKKGDKMCTGTKSNLRVSVCTVCGKEGQWTIIRNHIEANHIEGISHPCNFCDKTFRSKSSLANHISLHHKF